MNGIFTGSTILLFVHQIDFFVHVYFISLLPLLLFVSQRIVTIPILLLLLILRPISGSIALECLACTINSVQVHNSTVN